MNCFEQDIKLRAHWEQVITYVVLEQNLISPYRPWTASLANIRDWLQYFNKNWYLQSCTRDFPSHVEPVLCTPGCWCWWWCGAQWTVIVKISISRLSESSVVTLTISWHLTSSLSPSLHSSWWPPCSSILIPSSS